MDKTQFNNNDYFTDFSADLAVGNVITVWWKDAEKMFVYKDKATGNETDIGQDISGSIIAVTKSLTAYNDNNERVMRSSEARSGEDMVKNWDNTDEVMTYNDMKKEYPTSSTSVNVYIIPMHPIREKLGLGDDVVIRMEARGFAVHPSNDKNVFSYFSEATEKYGSPSSAVTKVTPKDNEYQGRVSSYYEFEATGETPQEAYEFVSDIRENINTMITKRIEYLAKAPPSIKTSAPDKQIDYPEGTINPEDIPF